MCPIKPSTTFISPNKLAPPHFSVFSERFSVCKMCVEAFIPLAEGVQSHEKHLLVVQTFNLKEVERDGSVVSGKHGVGGGHLF